MRIVIRGMDNRVMVDLRSAAGLDDDDLTRATATVESAPSSPSAEDALSGITTPAGMPLGTVTVFIDTSDLKASIFSAIIGSAVIAFLFWIAVLLATYPILKRVTGSFETLTAGLTRMMDGDFTTKIVIAEDNEAGRAAQAVNSLAAALVERDAENLRLQEELVNSMRLEVQEEKRQIMAKLIQTNRMTSLGLLISSMAHNINTPNGAIKLAAQHLNRSWKDALPILEQVTKDEGEFTLGGLPFGEAKAEILGASESVIANADRVERVIQNLREYNVGGKSEFYPGVSLNLVVSEAMTIIRAHGRQGEVGIVPDLAADLPDIVGNKYQLEQVVVNLLMNAMQATSGRNGVVKVRTEYDQKGHEARIIIIDKGDGIPPSVRRHLFEAFFSTRIDSGGSGLGLYISKFIVNEHRGTLTLESGQGDGTIATVCLPI
jgi:signal transduction histidine kinase